MSVEKLSISLDPELAEVIRAAAADEGVSVSTWLAGAADARARRRRLRDALDDFAAEQGALDENQIDRLITDAHERSSVVAPDAT